MNEQDLSCVDDVSLVDLLDYLREYGAIVEKSASATKLDSLERRWRRIMAAYGQVKREVDRRRAQQ